MTKPILYGADYSVYVRIARMTLIEKGVDHDIVPVDVFAPDGLPGWYRDLHPFGRIPALAHGDVQLYETAAIARYVDEAFAGPPLQPASPAARARMTMIVGMLDSYAYRPMVWDIAVNILDTAKAGMEPDKALLERALPQAQACLSELERLLGPGPWLTGESLSLADLHAAGIVGYFVKAPLARDMLARHARLAAWWERIAARPSFAATEGGD